jgi:hypothetical protein
MGALVTGTIIFAVLGFLAYFIVSALFRNDKDSQAYVSSRSQHPVAYSLVARIARARTAYLRLLCTLRCGYSSGLFFLLNSWPRSNGFDRCVVLLQVCKLYVLQAFLS